MCRRRLAASAAVLMLALGHDVRADELADARTAIDASDYAVARTALDAALDAGKAGPAELAEIYRMRGFVEGALGNESAATDAFAAWISLDAKASLPFGTSPKIQRPFDAAKAKMQDKGLVQAKAETGDDPPAVTLVVVNDPRKLIAGARVYFTVDKKPEQMLEGDGTDRIKIDLETGKRLDLRVQAIDKYGNRVVEIGSKDVPLVITSSGKTKQLFDPNDRKLLTGPVVPPKPRPTLLKWWVWGIGTVVVTGVGGFFAYRTYDGVQELDRLNANSLDYPWSTAQDVESRTRRDLLITNISAGVAGALAIGTAILYVTRPRASSQPETRATVAPIPGGGALVLGGRF